MPTDFYVCVENPNSGLQACKVSTLDFIFRKCSARYFYSNSELKSLDLMSLKAVLFGETKGRSF